MSTKNKFLTEVKRVFDLYSVQFPYNTTNGIPDGTINNKLNWEIQGFLITIPDENIKVCISGKEFIEYMCNLK